MFHCSVLPKGPSNGSMMAPQTTLFGTVVEEGQFFKALLSTNDSGYYVVVEASWTLECVHYVCNVFNNFLPTQQGGGGWAWATLKNLWIKNIAIYGRPLRRKLNLEWHFCCTMRNLLYFIRYKPFLQQNRAYVFNFTAVPKTLSLNIFCKPYQEVR